MVYALLVRSNNAAADRALVDALPDLDSGFQDVALDTLIQRNRPAGLARVVAAYPDWTNSLRQRVVARAEVLSAGLRLAVDSDSADTRLAAVEIIQRGNCAKCAYLLANALTRPCPKTRRAAGQAIEQLVTDFLDRSSQPERATAAELASQRRALAGAVRQAMNCWSAHRRTEVVRAAMWLAEDLEDVILARVAQPRLKLSRVFEESLRGRLDPHMAAYAVRALQVPELRGPVAAWIGNCMDDVTMVAVLDNLWLAGDVEVYRALSSIRRLAWLENGIGPLLDLTGSRAESAAILVGSSGLPNEAKVGLLESMARSGPAGLARAAVWQLVANRTREASETLREIARHASGDASRLAGRELKRRERAGLLSADLVPPSGANPAPVELNTFDAYWAAFDRLDEARQTQVGLRLRDQRHDFDRLLRQKLASADAADRSLGVRLVRRLGLYAAFDTLLFALAYDADARVRSAVVRALGHMDNPTSRRILSTALHDPDARVQANAIEALDGLEASQYQSVVRDKLASPNGRVRANAVKMLLKLELHEAVDALLNMLQGAARSDRLSALWVIECLRLESLTDRLVDLAQNDLDPQVRRRAMQVARTVGVEIAPAAAPAIEEAVP
ncbi:MAG: HEAT repeat domain-containing protein [Phycisphaerae bacterium]|nr:HEAT repeat domain-containing protein [Phycisphaerae bacterium]